MKPADLYHSGIVVDDVDATMRWLTDTAGYRWCDPYAGDQLIETPAGERTLPFHIAYTMDEPRLELLATVPGTCWVPSTSGIHHLGYWSDDVDRDVATLVANGLQVEARAPNPDGSSLWAYCKGPIGTRIELVSRTLEPLMTPWFTTGHSPLL